MNRQSLTICFALSIVMIISGCAGPNMTANLSQAAKKRGAYDFNCPEGKVTVKDIPGGSYAVKGCGKSTVYKCWRTGYEPNCIQEKNIPGR